MKEERLDLILLKALEDMLKAHGFIFDPECNQIECECLACINARATIEEAKTRV